MASLVSGRPTVVVSAKTRICAHKASSRPPPNATEETLAIHGIGKFSIWVNVDRRSFKKVATLQSGYQLGDRIGCSTADTYSSADILCLSLRSAPAQKTLSTSLAKMSALVRP